MRESEGVPGPSPPTSAIDHPFLDGAKTIFEGHARGEAQGTERRHIHPPTLGIARAYLARESHAGRGIPDPGYALHQRTDGHTPAAGHVQGFPPVRRAR